MKRKYLSKLRVLLIGGLSLAILNSIPVYAVTKNEAESIVISNFNKSDSGWTITKNDIEFMENIVPTNSKKYILLDVSNIIGNDENLYIFKDKIHMSSKYLVGEKTGKAYMYDAGHYNGSLELYVDGNINKRWTWRLVENSGSVSTWPISGWEKFNGWIYDNNSWKYLEDGIIKTGWIKDNGKWYYCYSNGKMASNTTISGYKLGANGAWIQ